MLFKPELCEAILQRKKTQTRRVIKTGESGYIYPTGLFNPDDIEPNDVLTFVKNPSGTIKWRVGRTYAIQPGSGKHGIGSIRLQHIRCQRLQDITGEDVIAEGVSIPPRDPDIMVTQYPGWYESTLKHEFSHLWDSINKEQGTRWNDNPWVWVLTFTLSGA